MCDAFRYNTVMQPALNLRAVLFDLDATLIDSRGVYEEAYRRVFADVLGSELLPQARRKYMGLPSIEFFRQYAGGERLQTLSDALRANLAEIMPHVQLFAGMPEVLEGLRRYRVKTAVVTSQNGQECQFTRRHIQIDRWIDLWVTIDDVSRPKPHPDAVLFALKRFKVQPKQALMVGDSPVDLSAGRDAGTFIAAACWGADDPQRLISMNPDFVFHKPEEMHMLYRSSPGMGRAALSESVP